MKKISIYFICLCFVLGVFLNSEREASAIAPLVIGGVVLSVEAVAGIATLLTACGITFSTSVDAQNAVIDLYTKAPSPIKSALEIYATGKQVVTNEVIDFVIPYIQYFYGTTVSNVVKTSDYYETQTLGDKTQVFPYSLTDVVTYTIGTSFKAQKIVASPTIALSDIITLVPVNYYYNGSLSGLAIAINGVVAYANGLPVCVANTDGTNIYSSTYNFYLKFASNILTLNVKALKTNGTTVNFPFSVGVVSPTTNPASVAKTITAVTLSPVTVAEYDFVAVDQTRTISVPTTVEEVLGKTFEDVQNPTGTTIVPGASTLTPIVDALTNKFPVAPLKNTLDKVALMNSSVKPPPVIKINLNSLFLASTNLLGSPESPFPNEESVFIDFGMLNNYSFASIPLIEYFRGLIAIGFLYNTLLYMWRKLVPKEVIA